MNLDTTLRQLAQAALDDEAQRAIADELVRLYLALVEPVPEPLRWFIPYSQPSIGVLLHAYADDGYVLDAVDLRY